MTTNETTSGKAPIERKLAGEEGLWVLIFGDMLTFSIFLYYRNGNIGVFQAGAELLDLRLGILNTLLLLTSSWFVASAGNEAKHNRPNRAAPLLLGGILCGVGFCIVKAFEYSAKIDHGITLNSSEFFIFYYCFTGIHLAHVVIGLGVLVVMYFRCKSPVADAKTVAIVAGGGAFWHMVDLLWIVLFALFYLVV